MKHLSLCLGLITSASISLATPLPLTVNSPECSTAQIQYRGNYLLNDIVRTTSAAYQGYRESLIRYNSPEDKANLVVIDNRIRALGEEFVVAHNFQVECMCLNPVYGICGNTKMTLADFLENNAPLVKPENPVPKPVLGECVAQDTIRGGAQYPNVTQNQCQQTCDKFLATAEPKAKVSDCRYLIPGKPELVLAKGRSPIVPVFDPPVIQKPSLCIAQDTIRGGRILRDLTKAACQSNCDSFFKSSDPKARVYDCRYMVLGQGEVVLTKGRPALK